jgi:hypothetical protein
MASPFELTRQMRAYETQTASYQNFLVFSSQPSTSTFNITLSTSPRLTGLINENVMILG